MDKEQVRIERHKNDVEKIQRLLRSGLKRLNFTSEIEIERESDSEAWIILPELGVSIFADAEGMAHRRTIGRIEVKTGAFQVHTIKYLPATRQEPEDSEYVLRHTKERVDDAVAEVFALVVKDEIYAMIEAEELSREFEKTQFRFRVPS